MKIIIIQERVNWCSLLHGDDITIKKKKKSVFLTTPVPFELILWCCEQQQPFIAESLGQEGFGSAGEACRPGDDFRDVDPPCRFHKLCSRQMNTKSIIN